MRVYATTQDADYDCPWQTSSPSSSTGSGVVIGPGQVLTGAHVVANATFLQVQKVSDPDKYTAHVVRICHHADLALLQVEDASFMKDVQASELGGLPHRQDRVSVVGYPVGGAELSVTEGVVSRIEVQRYSHSQRKLLAITVDAAINPGNSGGPAFKDGKVIGIAFQKYDNADNIGELVPTPLVRKFLGTEGDQSVVHVPSLSMAVQNMENPALRKQAGMTPETSGVLVRAVQYGGSAFGVIEPGDVLTSIDGLAIGNTGTVKYLGKYRTPYYVVVGDHRVGDTIEATVLRQGEVKTLQVTLCKPRVLAARSQYGVVPSYLIYGGLVFQPLSRNFLETWRKWWNDAPPELLKMYYGGLRTESRRQVVVLSQVLADESNVGYPGFRNSVIASVNGESIADLADLTRRLDAAEGLVEIRTSNDGLIVIDANTLQEANARVLERYRIQSDRSTDLPKNRDTPTP